MKKVFSLFVLCVLFVGAITVNNIWLKGARIDLTQNQVYSLSDGSKAVIDSLPQNVVLTLYYSNELTKGLTSLRNYSDQVKTLLSQYAASSKGKIVIEIVDPAPFSEQEDEAARYGLTAAPLDNLGATAYFGLTGKTATPSDDEIVVTIPFFDPSKEAFLEYDISKLLYQLASPEPKKLTLVADLQMAGGQDPMTGQATPANVIYSQLQQFFDVTLITSVDENLPSDTELLIVVHPKNLEQTLLYDIDQFVMSGGQSMFFVDPHFESDPMSLRGGIGANNSDMTLLEHYGITLATEGVVLDALTGLDIQTTSGSVTRHFGFLGLGTQQISRDEITTADLESLNGASFGALQLATVNDLTMETFLSSSKNSGFLDAQVYANTRDPEQFSKEFADNNTSYALGARFAGAASSFFDGALKDESVEDESLEGAGLEKALLKEEKLEDESLASDISDDAVLDSLASPNNHFDASAKQHIANTSNFNMTVFSDADMFIDRFWVQQSNFFGQTVYSPFANNGDLVINIAENLTGSKGLIGIRSRGTLARPFTTVEALEVVAQAKFSQEQTKLEQQLSQIEAQLQQVQAQQGDNMALSDAQTQAIAEFNSKRIEVRKALRDVRYQLDKDIDDLGNRLKLINIALAPVGLVILLWFLFKLLRRRAPRND